MVKEGRQIELVLSDIFNSFSRQGQIPTVPWESIMSCLRRIRSMYILLNPDSAEPLSVYIEASSYSSFLKGRVGNEAFIFGNLWDPKTMGNLFHLLT